MLFFPYLCSGILYLALGILETLIGVCFRDVLQPAFYKFVPCMICQLVQYMYSIYSKSLLFTSISYVQESFELTKSIMDKRVYLY